MTRDEAERRGAFTSPTGSTPSQRRLRLCWCAVCEEASVCAPSNDFYVRDGEDFLRCRGCVVKI